MLYDFAAGKLDRQGTAELNRYAAMLFSLSFDASRESRHLKAFVADLEHPTIKIDQPVTVAGTLMTSVYCSTGAVQSADYRSNGNSMERMASVVRDVVGGMSDGLVLWDVDAHEGNADSFPAVWPRTGRARR